MIKDKHPAPQPAQPSAPAESLPEEVSANPFVEIYRAVKRAVLTLRENPDDPLSPPLFKTVAIDNGQFARIVRDDNTEYETVFPAVFIHFINVRYLVQQQRIGEGRATMRVRFILNTLNNADEDKECEAFLVFQRLNVAIQDAKNHEPALSERCNLTYFRHAAFNQYVAGVLDRLRGMVQGIFRVEIQGLGKKVCGHAPVHPTQRCAAT